MTDMDTPIPKKRIPKDAFEIELFRRQIEAQVSRWQDVDASLDDYDEVDGSWPLHLIKSQEEFDMATFLDMPWIRGKVYLAEREYPASERYRVEVQWELGDQINSATYSPVIFWEARNPAGPWREGDWSAP